MPKFVKISLILIAVLPVLAILILTAGYFAVYFNLSKVSGGEDKNSSAYNQVASSSLMVIAPTMPTSSTSTSSSTPETFNPNYCFIKVVADISAYDALGMLSAYKQNDSTVLMDHMLLAFKLRNKNNTNLNNQLEACQQKVNANYWDESKLNFLLKQTTSKSLYTWINSEHWGIIKSALNKDKDAINKAASASDIQARMLVSVAMVEQLRLYYTQREFYEKFFKPLKILANANKMAWGVMSIKESMAKNVEQHLKDFNSPYYLGPGFSSLLDFPDNTKIDELRYSRLTDEHNHYYSYLYGGLIIKQLQNQWLSAGIDIKYRPEIIATLFNLGFSKSIPKNNPTVGGSVLEINGEKYYFGSLAYEFYYSGELIDIFPFK